MKEKNYWKNLGLNANKLFQQYFKKNWKQKVVEKSINPKKLQLQNCKKNCIISVVELFKKFLKVDKNENGKSTNSAVKQSLNLWKKLPSHHSA